MLGLVFYFYFIRRSGVGWGRVAVSVISRVWIRWSSACFAVGDGRSVGGIFGVITSGGNSEVA